MYKTTDVLSNFDKLFVSELKLGNYKYILSTNVSYGVYVAVLSLLIFQEHFKSGSSGICVGTPFSKGEVPTQNPEEPDNSISFGRGIDKIVLDILGDVPFPVISNFPCGHGRLMTMPISINARLECNEQDISLSFMESTVL